MSHYKKTFVFLMVFSCIILSKCSVQKKMSGKQDYLGTYMSTDVGDGGYREYLLIDDFHHVYSVLDTGNYCNAPQKTFLEDYSAMGTFIIASDSFKFSFDSCVFSTSVGYVMVHEQTMEIKTKTFRKDYRQWFTGKLIGNKLTFAVTTIDTNNDTIHSINEYVQCN